MQADKAIDINGNCGECRCSVFRNNSGEPHTSGQKIDLNAFLGFKSALLVMISPPPAWFYAEKWSMSADGLSWPRPFDRFQLARQCDDRKARSNRRIQELVRARGFKAGTFPA